MPKYTPERRAIRDRYKVLFATYEETRKRLNSVGEELMKLEEKCLHPAARSGSFLGMSWWECPDCKMSR